MSGTHYQTHTDVEPELLRTLEEHATDLARQAGTLLLSYFGNPLEVQYKSQRWSDPVTEADHAAENLIVEGIQNRFPDHGIITEETPNDQWKDKEFVWIIDPLDGTTNFVNRYPLFGSSIGVLRHGVPIVGAMFLPSPLTSVGEVFHARTGGGAYVDERKVTLSPTLALSPTRLSAFPSHFSGQFNIKPNLRRNLGETRTTGSIVFELSLVASGALQLAAFSAPKIWDVAAGLLILQEAGGHAYIRNQKREWTPFHSFEDQEAGLPIDGDLQKWGASLVVGNGDVATVMGTNTIPRPQLGRFYTKMHSWIRSKATAQNDENLETDKQGDQSSPESDSTVLPPR